MRFMSNMQLHDCRSAGCYKEENKYFKSRINLVRMPMDVNSSVATII